MNTQYAQWIKTLADLQGGRPFFSDQNPGSLELIGRLAEVFKPTLIVEAGTNYGLSLRRWKEVAPNTPIVAIDASFGPLRQSQTVLPIDLANVTLKESYLNQVDLKSLWKPTDVVLLYVDVHSDHEHVFNAIPTLPTTSIVVFDDVWRCNGRLVTETQKEEFFKAYVLPQVDRTAPMEIMPRCYSDYWRGGGFWGFDEVPKICAWSDSRRLTLHWEEGVKVVWFQWPQDLPEHRP
jgi:predicted O-methyltransferase YrrM